jgi:hypothetical protein
MLVAARNVSCGAALDDCRWYLCRKSPNHKPSHDDRLSKLAVVAACLAVHSDMRREVSFLSMDSPLCREPGRGPGPVLCALERALKEVTTETEKRLRLVQLDLSSPHRSSDRNQNAGTDEAGNEIANPSRELDAEESEQKACNRGSYYPQQNIHEQPHVALHELLGEPSSDSADNDGCDPADLLIFHGILRM